MTDGSIAIVGASCRFPGAGNLEEFWQLLVSAGDAVSEVDGRRWSTRFYYHPNPAEPGKSYTWSAGLIDDVDLFEPAFFGISPREAAQMDPQQRLLLELVWHALEHAGIPPSKISGASAGVYIGASATDYSDLRLGDPAGADSYFMTGSTLSILANRISYVFDLHGPSLAVDTACSSSLVALHHACEALRGNRIGSAIVGGVNLLLAPYPFIGFSRASMLSRRGRCFAFDERADGYVRGEGGAVVVLKPLKQALADSDPILAVIRATGVNSDGRTIGLSLPSEAAQASLLRSVHRSAGITPDELAFFEMHGTGTAAGDPIEAAAVGRSLGQSRSNPLPIGSVKSNIGHLEPASGMAGLLKAALALDREVIPPTLHCETPNPKIPFDTLNLRLARDLEPITRTSRQPYAGVNSFGFGGTNAHVVLAGNHGEREAPAAGPTPPLVISAQTEASLRSLAENWRAALSVVAGERAPSMLRAAARGRDQHPVRLIALTRDPLDTAGLLAGFLNDEPSPSILTGTALREGKLAFVFSGNGAQYAGMGRDALRTNAEFRNAVEELDRLLLPELGWSLAEVLANGADGAAIARADIAQPLLFAVQIGIVRALREIGVTASGCLGHSVGEIAAAWAAGALSLAEAGRVVIARSQYQQRTQGKGRMAALALAADAASDFLGELDSSAEIAAINASHSVTISGLGAEIERLEAEAKRRGLWFRPLDLDFAFHSREMDAIRGDLLESLAGLSSIRPSMTLISTVTGMPVGSDLLDADYWWRNIRKPVRFAEATAHLINEGCRILLEIGPSAILQSYLTDALRAAEVDGRVLASLSRKPVDADPFPVVAAQCFVAGYDLTESSWFDGSADPRGLPLYPWDRQKFWFRLTAEAADPVNPPLDHPLLGFRQRSPIPCWLNHLDEQLLPWISDHAVEGAPVLPAAAVVEIGLAAARCQWPDAPVLELRDLEVRRPLPFDRGRMRETRSVIVSEDGDWELASRPRLSNEPLTVHAVGCLRSDTDTRDVLRWADAAPMRSQIDRGALYRLAHRMGLDYGPRFRTVVRIDVAGMDAAVAHLDPSTIENDLEAYLLHPVLLDGALQALLGLLADRQHETEGISFLPWRFGRVRLRSPFGRQPRHARLKLTRVGVRSASADIALWDDKGSLVAELSDCWFRRVTLTRRGSAEERALHVDLVPAPLTESVPTLALECVPALLRSATDPEPDGAQHDQALLVEALIGSVALRSMLRVIAPGRRFTIDELVDTQILAPTSRPLAEFLLRFLERLGAAASEGLEWQVDSSADLPEPEEVWRLLLADSPDLVAELALIASALDSLPEVLCKGPKQPEAALSPMVEHLLQSSPASAPGIEILCNAVHEIAMKWPTGRPLRILELGAISGGATRCLLDRLAQSDVAFAYVATSDDPEQVARLTFLADSFIGVSARHWSPRNGNEIPDWGPFDLILAVNACARLEIDTASLAGLRSLLSSGGSFIAVEPEPNALWDVVFGQTPTWWQARSGASEGSPLRSAEEWRGDLVAAGFRSVDAALTATAPWPSALLWGSAPPVHESLPQKSVEPRSILVLTGNAALAAAVEERLCETGHHIELSSYTDAFGGRAADAPSAKGAPETVIFLAEEPSTSDPVECASQQIAALARVAASAAERRSELWVITGSAHQTVPGGAGASLVAASLWGLARVLINEMPRLRARLLDLPEAIPPAERARQISAELTADTGDSEIVWTPEGRHVLRVRRGLPPRWAESSALITLGSRNPGGLDSLGWKSGSPQSAGPGQVEIEVHAAGLNFRDMMWAMGLLPEEALADGFAGPTFGLECAGKVISVGEGVEDVAAGDRVMGFAPASLSTRVITMADALAPIPPQMSFSAAATVPVVFVTAVYALGHLAKLAPREHVLIHAAAGGVGLAAIQYAKHRGAIVIATAGSEVKRSFLRLAGADYVLDSRDLAFGNAVREITEGQGVDVVLNSLSGEGMERSLEVLRPFGRFLELGKRDLYLNRRIHLRPLRQNISYFAIDIDQLPIRRPDLARDLLAEVSSALSQGSIRPLAHRSFSFAEIDDAFRLMQSSSHIGKIVLVPRANAGVTLREPPVITARRDGTYLVTGGTDGFGYEAARWLVAQGAGSLALVSRRGLDTPGCDARVSELAAAGAEVKVYRGDVGDLASMARVLEAIRAAQPPLRGVVHAASAIDDGLASDIDLSRAEAVLRPKIGGALALDALTRNDPIELFLLFSSATTFIGAPAQGLYVAANAALEALARQRRAEGRPALAVAWGPIEDAGYLAERPDARDALARRLGAKPIPAAEALAGLPAMMATGLPVVAFAETNWNEPRRFLPILATPLFSEIRSNASGSSSDESLHERLVGLDPDAALALLKTVAAEEAATILRLPAGGIDPLRPLSEMGMDSLMAVELRLALENRLRVDLPLVSLAEGTSVASIAARLAAAISTGPKEGELLALVARHEGLDGRSIMMDEGKTETAMLDTKSVAAE